MYTNELHFTLPKFYTDVFIFMSPPNKFSGEIQGFSPMKEVFPAKLSGELPPSDVYIITSFGLRIPANSHILAMASPVLERLMERPKKHKRSEGEGEGGGERVIPILGVPCEAVIAFVRFLYTSRCTEEEMKRYGIHMLALAHVFSVPTLKQRCTKGLSEGLTIENVVDVVQLARLCDAPELWLKGMKLVANKFKAVEKTEGWRFLQKHDPWLELDILQFIDEVESRKKRRKRQKEEQRLYMQLGEAMGCLVHICTEGCTIVGPYDVDPTKKKAPCHRYSTCQGLQLLFKHFATCQKRVNGGCSRCRRMWQLLRLHAPMCDLLHHCRVPLCRQFKLKMKEEKKGEDAKWKLLVKKVACAKAISSLSLSSKRQAPHHHTIASLKF